MPVDHYENFPVASILLPKALRRPVELIYRFAREADDFADEGALTQAERLDALDSFHANWAPCARAGNRISPGSPNLRK